jgi:hypothetical protein
MTPNLTNHPERTIKKTLITYGGEDWGMQVPHLISLYQVLDCPIRINSHVRLFSPFLFQEIQNLLPRFDPKDGGALSKEAGSYMILKWRKDDEPFHLRGKKLRKLKSSLSTFPKFSEEIVDDLSGRFV